MLAAAAALAVPIDIGAAGMLCARGTASAARCCCAYRAMAKTVSAIIA